MLNQFIEKYCKKCKIEECDVGIRDFGTYIKCIDKNIIMEVDDVQSKKRNDRKIKK